MDGGTDRQVERGTEDGERFNIIPSSNMSLIIVSRGVGPFCDLHLKHTGSTLVLSGPNSVLISSGYYLIFVLSYFKQDCNNNDNNCSLGGKF